jgi:hypothetical protein
MQAIDERGTGFTQTLDRAFGFANRVGKFAKVAGRRQALMPTQHDRRDAAAGDCIVLGREQVGLAMSRLRTRHARLLRDGGRRAASFTKHRAQGGVCANTPMRDAGSVAPSSPPPDPPSFGSAVVPACRPAGGRSERSWLIRSAMTRPLCMRLGTGQFRRNPHYLHTVRRVPVLRRTCGLGKKSQGLAPAGRDYRSLP